MRDVFIVGAGIDAYRPASDRAYADIGLPAIRMALTDAGVAWGGVESTFVSTALLGVAVGRPMLRHLGINAAPIVHVENASASGSSAIGLARDKIAAGLADVVLVVGVDKPAMLPTGQELVGDGAWPGPAAPPIILFALMAERLSREYGWTREDLARVAAKNHANASLNPAAQSKRPVSQADILAAPPIAGMLTKFECCPVGEGGAAVVLASSDAIARLGLDRDRAVRIAASVSVTEVHNGGDELAEIEITRQATDEVLDRAGLHIDDIDLVELHDAFSIEELAYLDAMGISAPGRVAKDARAGHFDIGGRCAVSASGGLIGMGHPVGPTGIGQVVEMVRQMRGEAGSRQHTRTRAGLVHMVGLGAVCVMHVLTRT